MTALFSKGGYNGEKKVDILNSSPEPMCQLQPNLAQNILGLKE